jgi:hypothetical protein
MSVAICLQRLMDAAGILSKSEGDRPMIGFRLTVNPSGEQD